MSDTELAAIIHDPRIEIYALVVDGRDEGLLELDFRRARPMRAGLFRRHRQA